MHFWINKGATSFTYGGRRRPTFYSSGTFASAGFGRERNNLVIPPRYPSISSSSSASHASNGSDHHHLRSPRTTSNNATGTNTASYIQNSHSRRINHHRNRDRRSNSTPILPVPYHQTHNGTHINGTAPEVHVHRHSHHVHDNPRLRQFSSTSTTTTLDSSDSQTGDPEDPCCCCCSCCKLSTKRIGLTLCFTGFILLCTVGAKFIVEGPYLLDSHRNRNSINPEKINITQPPNKPGGSGTTSFSYFLTTEILFVAFALGFFLLGIACLRKRTNEYLLRQYRQQIRNSSRPDANAEVDGVVPEDSFSLETTYTSETERELHISPRPSSTTSSTAGLRFIESSGGPGRSRRYYNLQHARAIKQEPPPYDVALYLPLPKTTTNPIAMEHHRISANLHPFKPCKSQGSSTQSLDKLSLSAMSTNTISETPPPSYQEQFIYEI